MLGSTGTGTITLLTLKLLSDYLNICDHKSLMLQTDR